jgi:hypothetical protein
LSGLPNAPSAPGAELCTAIKRGRRRDDQEGKSKKRLGNSLFISKL